MAAITIAPKKTPTPTPTPILIDSGWLDFPRGDALVDVLAMPLVVPVVWDVEAEDVNNGVDDADDGVDDGVDFVVDRDVDILFVDFGEATPIVVYATLSCSNFCRSVFVEQEQLLPPQQ
jgi:hypothetical protein